MAPPVECNENIYPAGPGRLLGRTPNERDHRSSITNIKAVKYSRIFTNIKTGYEYYNLLFFSSFIFWNNKAQAIVQNQLLFITLL